MRRAFLTMIARAIGKRQLEKFINPNLWNLDVKPIEYLETSDSFSEIGSITDSDFDDEIILSGVQSEVELKVDEVLTKKYPLVKKAAYNRE